MKIVKVTTVDMERLFDLLNEKIDVKDSPDALPLVVREGEIIFDHVTFSYDTQDESSDILRDVSFKVKAGSSLAIVGQSGGGKSSLLRLLCRFYDLTSGKITIDEQDISKVTQKSLRKAIGVVPQDSILFNDTIRYNIGYSLDLSSLTSQPAIERAAKGIIAK